jgi:methylthioribose-1-phosphate isomerase
MKVDGKSMRSIWLEPDGWSVGIIDQTALPHRLVTVRLATLEEAAHAIRAMLIRGAPLIGATAAYGICLALRADASDEALDRARST